MPDSHNDLRVLLHAPSAAALLRARSNAANLAKDAPLALVRIVINGAAVAAALDDPNPVADAVTLVCPNTLRTIGCDALAPLTALESGAIFALTTMQRDGWCYVRA